ncbi:MAG TPA: thioredoxin [Chloroflexi bacterium]|nr:MAG: thioredoxin [Chloroflexota bacterium]HDD55051.1 thioredoxin [Chloroflexota bacterium]
MAEVNYVTGEEFEEKVLGSDLPVLVDFTAAWCGPCKMVSPLVEELAGEWEEKARVYKMDVDTNQAVPVQYGIMGIPALLLFVNGDVVARVAGFKPKKQLQKTFEPHL